MIETHWNHADLVEGWEGEITVDTRATAPRLSKSVIEEMRWGYNWLLYRSMYVCTATLIAVVENTYVPTYIYIFIQIHICMHDTWLIIWLISKICILWIFITRTSLHNISRFTKVGLAVAMQAGAVSTWGKWKQTPRSPNLQGVDIESTTYTILAVWFYGAIVCNNHIWSENVEWHFLKRVQKLSGHKLAHSDYIFLRSF